MAAVIKNFRVVTLGLDNERLDLLWEFVVPADALRYEVWVERSGGAVGPFQILAKDYNAIAFTDFTVNRKSANIHYHYRLRVVPRDDPQESATVELTGVKALEPERDLVAAEIERRNNLLYQEYTGRRVLVYRRRTEGQRCPDCWGEEERQQTQSKCETCFDTGFIVGFYNPLALAMNFVTDPEQLRQDLEVDEIVNRTASASFGGRFRVFVNDLIVEKEGQRWAIVGVDYHEKLRALVSQHLKLNRIVESDILFKIPLAQTGILDVLTPEREFTRPYTLNP